MRDYNKQTEWKKNNADRINFEVPKGYKDKIKESAGSKSMNQYILECIENAQGEKEIVPDLSVYAKSAGLTTEEYIKSAVLEKMQRQDQEYTEDIKYEKIND